MLKKSISRQLNFAIILTLTIVITIFSIIIAILIYDRIEEQLKEELNNTIALAVKSLNRPVWVLNYQTINVISDAILRNKNIIYFSVNDEDNIKLFSKSAKDFLISNIDNKNLKDNYLVKSESILFNNENIGTVTIVFSKQQIYDALTSVILIILIVTFVLIFIISLIVMAIIKISINNPLNKLKMSAKEIADGNYATKIDCTKEDETGDLAKTFDYLMQSIQSTIIQANSIAKGDFSITITPKSDKDYLSLAIKNMGNEISKRDTQIKEKLKEISDIFSAIDQGIFTLNLDLSLNKEHSRKAEELFNWKQDFTRADICKFFNLNDETLNHFKVWLQALQKPQSFEQWSKIALLSPVDELVKDGNRILKISFKPIIENNKIAKIMVLATDVTEQRAAEKKLSQSRKKHELQIQRIINLISNEKEILDIFFNDVSLKIKKYHDFSSLEDIKAAYTETFRGLHSIKGTAGSIGFCELAEKAHNAETRLLLIKTNKKKIQSFNGWRAIINELEEEYNQIINTCDMIFKNQGEGLFILRQDFNALLVSIFRKEINSVNQVFEAVYNLDSIPLNKYSLKFKNTIELYCQKTGKHIAPLEIQSSNIKIHREIIQIFDPAVVHIIRNAMDHGIENADLRERMNKGPGQITLNFKYSQKKLEFIISDDGAGINPDFIAQKAYEKGLISKKELTKLSDQEKINLIFQSGFSTKTEVTETSGRGIGMDAVKNILEKYKGGITYHTIAGQGSTFTLWLPIDVHLKLFSEHYLK
ncbi:ATP-binding protein [Candidatus Margulisiibacteriota bacterium]